MVEYLSAVVNKTILENQKSFGITSPLKKLRLPLLALIIVVLALVGYLAFKGGGHPDASINKSFTVSARTSTGIRVRDANLNVKLTDATMANNLLVQSHKATTSKGKTFLIVDMEIENKYDVPLYALPVDLFRLIRADGEKIAPSVHQGTVEIRPISTKKSNVGFVVDPNGKNFKLEVGELLGTKDVIEILFK